MKIRFVTWDWKEQPDIGEFNESLASVFNDKNAPCVILIDTGSDSYTVVVSGEIIDEKQAQRIYDIYDCLPDGKDPYNETLDIECP